MIETINVGVLGCTGNVGQKLIHLLSKHPFFKVTDLVASERSAGYTYGEKALWREEGDIPKEISHLKIKSPNEHLDAKILFSGLDASVAGEIESNYANEGHIVVSNSKNHRMDIDVPLIIPEINGPQVELIKNQNSYKKRGGFIVTNPNCSTIVLALAIFPIFRDFGISNALVTTMQAISGAGYPGVPSLDIFGNVIPYIAGEEEKIETELIKIFSARDISNFKISASCNRVPVKNGHTMSIVFDTIKKSSAEEIKKSLLTYPELNLHSSPKEVLRYIENQDRPQPVLDVMRGNGMTISVGNLRRSSVLDWKFTAFGNNIIRGAAGAAILNAEYIVNRYF
jgi:aspartate-semialdehyde dehydrogenase